MHDRKRFFDNLVVQNVRGLRTVYYNKRRYLLDSEEKVGKLVEPEALTSQRIGKPDTARRMFLGTDLINDMITTARPGRLVRGGKALS